MLLRQTAFKYNAIAKRAGNLHVGRAFIIRPGHFSVRKFAHLRRD